MATKVKQLSMKEIGSKGGNKTKSLYGKDHFRNLAFAKHAKANGREGKRSIDGIPSMKTTFLINEITDIAEMADKSGLFDLRDELFALIDKFLKERYGN